MQLSSILVSVIFVLTCFAKAYSQHSILSDGRPITIEDKGITITPPVGWSLRYDFPGTTLLMLAPDGQDKKYQRSIQLMSFPEPYYIDELGAGGFKEVIFKNFSSASAQIRDYVVKDPLPVDLDSGVKGYLYYADFKIGDDELMQMHVLVSSAKRHFVITYTDLKNYFSSSAGDSDHLNEAWATTGSIVLESNGPSRLELPVWLMAIALSSTLFFVLYLKLRDWRVKKTYTAYAEDNYVPEEGDEHELSMTPATINSRQALGTLHEGTLHVDESEDDVEDELAFRDSPKRPFKAS